MKRIIVSSMGLLLAACASQPAVGPSAPAPAPADTGAVDLAPRVTTLLNIAATSSWVAEERLLPADPILALIEDGGSVESPAGLSITCNPANGSMTARLPRQAADRVGQEATFRIRMGRSNEALAGRFEANKRGGADFVFPMDPVRLRTMGQFDEVVFLTDAGRPQWAFVREPGKAVEAEFVGSLRNLNAESTSYILYCNPK
ncbi:hypothetical protein GC169_09960 [bacterium]|nr:hypothetical protein [bacterium]